MKNECSIVRDLLPLYVEKMVSDGTAAFVEDHLKDCEACREELEHLQAPMPPDLGDTGASLKTLNRKLRARRIQTIALTAILVTALLVSAFAVLTTPIFFPYREGLVSVGEYGENGVLLTFDPAVRHISTHIGTDPDDSSVSICEVEAWTTLWETWFSEDSQSLSSEITAPEGQEMLLFYVPNTGSESVCLARYDPLAEHPIGTAETPAGMIVLPRLSLGYYLIGAVAALIVMILLRFATRRKPQARLWVERIGLYPVAYIASHCILTGCKWVTYSLPHDFAFLLFLSVVLYCGLLLAHSIWHLNQEIRESTLQNPALR